MRCECARGLLTPPVCLRGPAKTRVFSGSHRPALRTSNPRRLSNRVHSDRVAGRTILLRPTQRLSRCADVCEQRSRGRSGARAGVEGNSAESRTVRELGAADRAAAEDLIVGVSYSLGEFIAGGFRLLAALLGEMAVVSCRIEVRSPLVSELVATSTQVGE